MKEGYWIRTSDGQKWKVGEHAMFAKDPDNMELMGLPLRTRIALEALPPSSAMAGPDRDAIVLEVCKAGYIRMRGHGHAWTFEYFGNREKSLWAAWQFAADWAGPFTHLQIHDLKTNDGWSGSFKEFDTLLKAEGPEGVIRRAASVKRTTSRTS